MSVRGFERPTERRSKPIPLGVLRNAWLEKAFQEHATFLRYLKVHPLFDGLRDDPRFDALVKRMGIPD